MSEKKYFSLRLIVFSIILLLLQLRAQENFWQQTNGPSGCKINIIKENSKGDLFAGTESNGIYILEYSTNSWTPINNGILGNNVNALAINDSDHIFISVMNLYDPINSATYLSKNNGQSWINIINLWGTCLAIDTCSNIFLGTKNEGIFKSTDNGENWIMLLEDPYSPQFIYHISVNDLGYIYVASTDDASKKVKKLHSGFPGIYFSFNSGVNWNLLFEGNFSTVVCNNVGNVLAGATFHNFLYISNDFGLTWTKIDDQQAPLGEIYDMCYIDDSTAFAGTKFGLFFSMDSGYSWQQFYNIPSENVYSIENTEYNGTIIGTTYGVMQTNDRGQTWNQINYNLPNPHIYSLASNDSGFIFAGAHKGGVYVSDDKGNTWKRTSSYIGPPSFVHLSEQKIYDLKFNSTGRLFAGTSYEGGLFYSNDHGDTWNLSFFEQYSYGGEVWTVAINDSGLVYIGTNGNGIWVSYTGGERFEFLSFPYATIRTLYADKFGNLYAGILNGGAYLSSDQGEHWEEINTGLTSKNIYSIAAGSKYVYAATSNGIFRSSNQRQNWKLLNNGIPEVPVSKVIILNDTEVYAGTFNKGVYYSSDNGEHWIELNLGLTNLAIWSVTLDVEGYLYTGTDQGVFRSISPVTTINNNTLELPEGLRLFQNYPNPFNSSTIISFMLPKAQSIKIEIYNVAGKKIRTILNEYLSPENYSVKWDGKNEHGKPVASGIYYYVIKTYSFLKSKKMILIR